MLNSLSTGKSDTELHVIESKLTLKVNKHKQLAETSRKRPGILHVTGINLWHVFTMKLSDRSVSSSSLANNCINTLRTEKLNDRPPFIYHFSSCI